MTLVLGNVPASTVLYIPFATYSGTSGASLTMTGLAVTDIEIYKNGSTTQRASDNGYTLLDTDGIDFDGITGIHGFSVDLADNSDSGFFAVGSWYWVVVSSVTVDGQTVNFIAAIFRIVAAEAVTGKPKVDVDAWLGTAAATPTVAGVPEVDVTHWLGTAAATPTVAGVPEVDATHWRGTALPAEHTAGYPIVTVKDGTGTGELDTASGVVLAKDHAGANLATAAALDAVDNFVDTEIADIQARLPAALTADGNIKADTLRVGGTLQTAGDIIGDTNDIQARLPAALVSGRIDASVGAVAANAITAAAIATGAIDADAIATDAVTEIQAGLSTLDAAGVRTAVGLASANLDTQLDALPTAAENADKLLGRAIQGAADGGRTVTSALRKIRNRVAISGGTLTVYQENDSTADHTAAVTTAAGNPITEVDPA